MGNFFEVRFHLIMLCKTFVSFRMIKLRYCFLGFYNFFQYFQIPFRLIVVICTNACGRRMPWGMPKCLWAWETWHVPIDWISPFFFSFMLTQNPSILLGGSGSHMSLVWPHHDFGTTSVWPRHDAPFTSTNSGYVPPTRSPSSIGKAWKVRRNCSPIELD